MKRILNIAAPALLALSLNAADGNATKTHKVKAEPFKVEIALNGIFAAVKAHPVIIRPKAWADLTLAADAVGHGARVAKGDVLVQLKTDKLEQKIADGRLTLEAAKLDMAVAQAEYAFATNSAALDRATAVRTLARLQEDFDRYEKKIKLYNEKSAKFSLTSSEHSLAYAREELKQLQKMYEADDITEETEEIILKRAKHTVARSQHFLERTVMSTDATLKLTLPREHEDKTDALTRAQLATVKATGTHEEKLRKLAIGLTQQVNALKRAEEAQAKLESDLDRLTIKAPATGVVYYGKFTDGVWGGQKLIRPKLRAEGKLTAGEVFITVVEERPLQILGNITEKDFRKVNRADTGWATPTAAPADRVGVKVTHISRVPTAPGLYAVALSADAANQSYLLPGMNAAVKLKVYENAAALTVPNGALHVNAQGKSMVKRKGADGNAVETVVKLGVSHGGKTEVKEGLKEGDEILVP